MRPVSLGQGSRLLFGTALLIFVITIVIGILNGLDIWEPDHESLLTHVHAGTLGWITLAVVAVALPMFGAGEGAAPLVARAMAGTIALYVIAFWSTTGVLRPIAGSLVFLAVAWLLYWAVQQVRGLSITIPQLAMLGAIISLTFGAVLGVILGIQIADGQEPGNLAEAHPPTMVIGFLILAGMGIAEWLLRSESDAARDSRAGSMQVALMFVSGLILTVALIVEVEPLLGVANLMQVIGIGIFIWRLRQTFAGALHRPVAGWHTLASIVFLLVNLLLLIILVQGIISERYDVDRLEETVGGLILALDHAMFIGVMTNILFAGMAAGGVGTKKGLREWIFVAVNAGLVVFMFGLMGDNSILKQIGTPVMGAALLTQIALCLPALKIQLPGLSAPKT
jgi:hypothetical protein